MQDFLTFKTFISPTVLMVMYILGVFVMPIIAWWMAMRARKYLPSEMVSIPNKVFSKMDIKDKMTVIAMVLFILLCMEICWRMMFEFLLAYLQIREVLVGI